MPGNPSVDGGDHREVLLVYAPVRILRVGEGPAFLRQGRAVHPDKLIGVGERRGADAANRKRREQNRRKTVVKTPAHRPSTPDCRLFAEAV